MASAQDGALWIVTDDDAAQSFVSSLVGDGEPSAEAGFAVTETVNGLSIARLDPSLESPFHTLIHDEFNRCGGYTVHESLEAARAEAENPFYDAEYLGRSNVVNPVIDQGPAVSAALAEIDPAAIVSTIQMLEAKGTRHYLSATGEQAAEDVRALWASLGAGRSDVSVARYPHPGWPQDSVIATIRGNEAHDEIVVIGGHLDSINPSNLSDAPGADDDASGVAVVTEVLRALIESDFKPRRTLQFMAYAAEEVGLRGSRAIAEAYANDPRKEVIAALQMDMTGYQGSSEDLYFITDYVSADLTDFLKALVQTYNGPGPHEITYGETSCGYACSDHAAWTGEGIPAAFPFEALFNDFNPAIHSSNDTLTQIDGTGAKQAKFAKLGVEFMIEVAKSAGTALPEVGRRMGFAWADQPSSALYTPSATYAYNGAGGAITASRSGPGVYTMHFAGLGGNGVAGAHIQVSGYGASRDDCKIAGWSSNGSDLVASVRCVSPSGIPVDARYSIYATWP
ncbi:M20/M25/M40 family metallo-hydrolase [Paracoccaceae bacterium GXU_MW_L88]